MKMKFNTKRNDRASEIYEQINMYDRTTFKNPRMITALSGKRQQRHILKALSSFFLRWIESISTKIDGKVSNDTKNFIKIQNDSKLKRKNRTRCIYHLHSNNQTSIRNIPTIKET